MKLRKYEKIGLFTFIGAVVITSIAVPLGSYLSYYSSTHVTYKKIALKQEQIELDVNSSLDQVDFGPYVPMGENENISLKADEVIVSKPEATRAALGATYEYKYALANNEKVSAIGKAVVSNKFYATNAEIINGSVKMEDGKSFAGSFEKEGGAVNFRFDYCQEGEHNLKFSISNGYVKDDNGTEYMEALELSKVLSVFVNGEYIPLDNITLPEVRGDYIWTTFHEIDLGKVYFHAYRNIVTLQFIKSDLFTKWLESPRCNIEYLQILE